MNSTIQALIKRTFLLIVCGGLILLSHAAIAAGIGAIPVKVTNAFKMKYPAAKNVEWDNKIVGCQANFQMDNTRFEAKFNKKGEWQRTEKAEKEYMMPGTVKDGFEKSKYKDWKIKSSYVYYYPKEGSKYHIVAKKGFLRKKNLVFNQNGQLIKDRMTI